MEVPIYIDGESVGKLVIEEKGLMTAFTAQIDGRQELVRLAVFGGGQEGYLGVMLPEDGSLVLRKKLSRAAMAGFPARIEYAAPSGGGDTGPRRESEEEPAREAEPPAEKEQPGDEKAASPEMEADAVHAFDPVPHTVQEPPSGELLWFSAPDGSLSAFDGERMLVALPADNPRVPKGAERVVRNIDGREYIVFSR